MDLSEDDLEEANKLLEQMEFEISTRSNEILGGQIEESLNIMQSSIDNILSKIDLIRDDELATKLTRAVGINMAGMMKAIICLKRENLLLHEKGFAQNISQQNPDLN